MDMHHVRVEAIDEPPEGPSIAGRDDGSHGKGSPPDPSESCDLIIRTSVGLDLNPGVAEQRDVTLYPAAYS
jgi:hypothetical protein